MITGSLQTKNGKYYAVINLTDINGKRKQKWIATGLELKGNKRNSEQFLRDKIKEYELKGNIIPTDILFSDYILLWLKEVQIKIDKNTYLSYSDIIHSHIVPYFNEKKLLLSDVKRTDIQEYINYKFKQGRKDGKGGLSAKTVKSHIVLIKQALKEAVKSNFILSNPSDYVTLPKSKKFEPTFYTNEQLTALFTAIRNDDLFPLIYCTVVFGLRRSEALGLKWDSVNFSNNTLTIKHTVVGTAEIIEKDQTKNASSYRSYPISEEIRNIFLSLKEQERNNRNLFGNEYIENDYIFKWQNGKQYTPDYVTKKFQKLLKMNNLPHIRFHDLRHSCASLLVANGFTIKDIQEWLGHADIQTTANIYAHLDVERKNKISNSIVNSLHF